MGTQINGYFRLEEGDGETFIKLFGAKEGGKPLDMNELEEYLLTRRINFDKIALAPVVKENKDTTVRLNRETIHPVNEGIKLIVSEDKMTVTARFYPPTQHGGLVTADEIQGDFRAKHIKANANLDVINDFLKNKIYCTDYVVAVGKPAREGHDGNIEYCFDTDPLAKPKLNEDGSVDFHALSLVHACAKDQLLAKLTKEDPGDPGVNVFGEVIKPRDVKRAAFKHGRDIYVSENGTELHSGLDGHVNLIDDTVFVSGVLELENVDVATGDVNFEGNISIAGNVATGYKVSATGDIEIRGIIEAAEVTAGGSITVAKGINGMSKGVVKAGGDIATKYINSATVEAGANIRSELILNSEVSASEKIVVQGKKGFITGGHVKSGKEIEAKIIGSDMGVDTIIEVGVDPALKARFAKLQKDNDEYRKKIAIMEPVVVAASMRMKKGEKLPPDQIQKIIELSNEVKREKQLIEDNTKELAELSVNFDSDTEAQIVVNGQAHAGTRLVISEATLVLKTDYHYCRFRKESGDVKMLGL
ncbi:MAG: FapA family protein [Lachnospiraceae bacterium]|nr:FapA family protein [Lachnospiraceae bacterium]